MMAGGGGAGVQREGSREAPSQQLAKKQKPQAFSCAELDSANHTSECRSRFFPRAS